MVEKRRAQLSFGDGLIAEEVSDLREAWMAHADEVLTDETIEGILTEVAGPDDAVDQLVDLTLRGGAPDNVSVVLADVAEAPIAGRRKYHWRHSG